MPKLTNTTAAQVRAILEVAAGTVPPSDEVAAAGLELDRLTADTLDLAPVLTRPWHRRAERYAADQSAMAAADAADHDDVDGPA